LSLNQINKEKEALKKEQNGLSRDLFFVTSEKEKIRV